MPTLRIRPRDAGQPGFQTLQVRLGTNVRVVAQFEAVENGTKSAAVGDSW